MLKALLQKTTYLVESKKLSAQLRNDIGRSGVLLIKADAATKFVKRFNGAPLAQEAPCSPLFGFNDWAVLAKADYSDDEFAALLGDFNSNFRRVTLDVIGPLSQNHNTSEEYEVEGDIAQCLYAIDKSLDFKSLITSASQPFERLISDAFGVENSNMSDEDRRWQADLEEASPNDLPHHDDGGDDDYDHEDPDNDFGPDPDDNDSEDDDDYDRRNGW